MTTGPASTVPALRIRAANRAPVNGSGARVVYWMIAARRTAFNFGLQRAADWARHLGLPLLVLEALRVAYPWASDRLHRFVLDGLADNAAALAGKSVAYLPYVEPEAGAGRGLLAALAEDAAVVVTDDYPTFFLPRMVAAAAARLPVRLEAVDGNGLLPMAAADREFATAYSFRRHLQKTLLPHLEAMPLADPLTEALPPAAPLPEAVARRWPAASAGLLGGDATELAALPIDHSVAPAPLRGGPRAASERLEEFLETRLEGYVEDRNRPEADAASGLSPYLHFGHVSPHEIFLELMRRERWTPEDVQPPANGRRAGWWGVREGAEAFLDQVVTWRELGFNVCATNPQHDRWESLPEWAQRTLTEHAVDPREHTYSLEEFSAGATHDPLWNAAQNQLRSEGTIHNYLRMLWGKKILEWTTEPREALEVMIELNNGYALDGRDPNSYSGIFWVLGRHDRAWGPERPIFGTVRYMSSANTARKFPVRGYLERYGSSGGSS
ncbi:MAG TPA: deoxyribodipyrimidine photolyase [Chondromyces sp.]|nr:deoxyribodipyrimidine photolyase [Chondromyces sp.]